MEDGCFINIRDQLWLITKLWAEGDIVGNTNVHIFSNIFEANQTRISEDVC